VKKKNEDACRNKATPISPNAIEACIRRIQNLFVFKLSIKGLQKGLITQGK
jgi:hypothetical protein